MPWNLILLSGSLFFIYVMIYIALLTSSLALAGKAGPMEMNLWLLTAPCAGFMLFAFTFRRFSQKQFRQLLSLFVGLLGIAIVLLTSGITANAGSVCTGAGLLLFPLGIGYVYGYNHYLMCRWLPPARRGLCIGLGIALPNILQFLVDWLLRVTAAPPLFLWGLLLVVLAMLATLLLRTKAWGFEEQPIAPNPLLIRNLPLLCCIAATMGLLIGLDDSLSLARYREYADWHFLSRLFSAIGFMLAGWFADRHPMWLPLAALLSKAVVLAFHVLALEGYPFWIAVCGDAFFSASLGLFVIWLFVTVALHTRRPELWAGMGRTTELPVAGLGAMLGIILTDSLPSSAIMLVYMAVTLLAVMLFYRCFLLYSDTLERARTPILLPHTDDRSNVILATTEEDCYPATFAAETEAASTVIDEPEPDSFAETIPLSSVSEPSEPDKPQGEAMSAENPGQTVSEERLREYKAFYNLSVRETDVLREILLNHSISEISEVLFISPRTVKFHISSILKKTGAVSQHRLKRLLEEHDKIMNDR